jgi:hypothetical protein
MKAIALALAAWPFLSGIAVRAEPERQRICFSAQETRDKIVTHKLIEPFRVLKASAALMQAEAIGAKLCRWKDELVYEISLLRRDGHILHVFVSAVDGHTLGSRNTQ